MKTKNVKNSNLVDQDRKLLLEKLLLYIIFTQKKMYRKGMLGHYWSIINPDQTVLKD